MTDISKDQLWARLKDEGVHIKVLTELSNQNTLSVSGLVDTCRNSHLTTAQKLGIEDVRLLDAFPLRVLSALNRHTMALQATTSTSHNTIKSSTQSQPPSSSLLSKEQTVVLETAGKIWPNPSHYTAVTPATAGRLSVVPVRAPRASAITAATTAERSPSKRSMVRRHTSVIITIVTTHHSYQHNNLY